MKIIFDTNLLDDLWDKNKPKEIDFLLNEYGKQDLTIDPLAAIKLISIILDTLIKGVQMIPLNMDRLELDKTLYIYDLVGKKIQSEIRKIQILNNAATKLELSKSLLKFSLLRDECKIKKMNLELNSYKMINYFSQNNYTKRLLTFVNDHPPVYNAARYSIYFIGVCSGIFAFIQGPEENVKLGTLCLAALLTNYSFKAIMDCFKYVENIKMSINHRKSLQETTTESLALNEALPSISNTNL